jgi:hypothetical protein
MTELEETIFQAYCQINRLQGHIERGAKVEATRDDAVTLSLRLGGEMTIELIPVRRMMDVLRAMEEK